RQRGFQPQFELRRDWQRHLFQTRTELMFFRESPRCTIDLHWGLLPPGYGFTRPDPDLWRRTETVTLGGTALHTLGPEDTLLFFALHAAKHDWNNLRWLCDLAQLLRARPGLDWDAIDERARRGHCE